MPITIKKNSGKIIKTFTANGIANVESAILWILRELFVSLIASNHDRLKKRIPDFLMEIEDIVGWQGLEKMVCGGKSCMILLLEFNWAHELAFMIL